MQTLSDGNLAITTYLSVGIALTEFIAIVIFHLYLSLMNIEIIRNLKFVEYVKRTFTELKTKKTSSKTEIILKVETPTTSVVSIREPLLEDTVV